MSNSKISALTSATTPLAGTELLPVVQSNTTKKVTVADLLAGVTVSAGFSASITGGGTVYLGSSNSYGNLAVVKNQVGTTKVGVSNNDATANSGVYFSSYYNTTEIGAFGHYWDGGAFINRIKYFGKQEFAEGTTVRVQFEQTSGDITAVTGNFVQGTAAKGINFTANTPASGMTSQLLNWYEEGTWTPNQGAGLTLVGAFSSAGTYTRIGRQVFIRGSVSGATSIAVASAGAITTNLPYSAAADATGTAINAADNASSILRVSSATLTAATAIAATTTITFSAVYSV